MKISDIIRHVTDGAVKLTEELELLGYFPKDGSDDISCCNRALDALYYDVEPNVRQRNIPHHVYLQYELFLLLLI
jgi:hypothetical protein